MRPISASAALTLSALLLVACSQQESETPAVSFAKDIQPLLAASCLSCHTPPEGKGYAKSGLDMTSHAALMKGTQHGSVINPGSSIDSTLVMLVEGRADPSLKMPHGDQELSEEQIALLKRWVDEGAKDN